MFELDGFRDRIAWFFSAAFAIMLLSYGTASSYVSGRAGKEYQKCDGYQLCRRCRDTSNEKKLPWTSS